MTKTITTRLPKQVRDRDVIHDLDGRVFVTLGYIQPQDRILCFLKYIVDPQGDWHSGNASYRRVFWGGVDSVVKGMALVPSMYLVNDAHFRTELLELPRHDVAKYFSPELRLSQIIHEGPADDLEAGAKHLAEIIHDTLGISFRRLGVTGSISWKAHNPKRSDINMNVYGFKEAWHLQEGYDEIAERNRSVRLVGVSDRLPAISKSANRQSRPVSDALQTLSARRREFHVDGRGIGVMPVLMPTEAPIQHGREHYVSLAETPVTIRMEIEETKYGLFMPAIYEGTSKPMQAIRGKAVTRIMVYDGLFRGLLQPGDKADVTGMLQRVEPNPGENGGNEQEFYQIMVGTKNGYGSEFISAVGPSRLRSG